jgi:indolepyruvate ferredoxin oxidoreductase beta subunit
LSAGKTTNIVLAGLGGQGVLKASDIVAEAAFRAGMDVKKSELHGMSQRGGSVTSDVRFGARVLSPMIPPGEADFLVALEPTQVENNRALLAAGGTLIAPEALASGKLRSAKSLNVALLGILSTRLEIPIEAWLNAIRANLPEKSLAVNLEAFEAGRSI